MSQDVMRWIPKLRFHQQLVLVVSALLIVATVLLGGYTGWAQYQSARQSLALQASTLARFMALSSGNLILSESLDQVETLALRMVELPDVQAIRVVDSKGRNLTHVMHRAQGGPLVVFDAPSEHLALPSKAEPLVELLPGAADRMLAWHPVVAGELVGWVQVTHSTEGLAGIWQQILRSTLVVALMAVALCGALLALVLRHPMSALAAATRFAVNLGPSKGRQMPVPRGPVEVVQLSEALNDASARLHNQMLDIQVGVDRLREHEAQLEVQNEQLDAIFTLSPDGLVTFDREGRVRFANHAFMLLTGLDDTQVLGRSMAELDDALAASVSNGVPFPGLSACLGEPGARHNKGVLITVARPQTTVIRLLAQRSATPTVAQVLYAVDVTQQHQLDTIKSEFLSMAACVGKALADFKVPEGREPPHLTPLDDARVVRVDADKLQQALCHVLSNAYKYSPQGGAVQVGVVITDHGMALKPDELARLAERFFRADKSGNIPGSGLGVSLVRELMALMGGHFEVQSRCGEGTSVTLWLPLQTSAAQCPA